MYNKDKELIVVVVHLGVGMGATAEAYVGTPTVTDITKLPNLKELVDIIEEKFSDK